jgi:hypothetical protein
MRILHVPLFHERQPHRGIQLAGVEEFIFTAQVRLRREAMPDESQTALPKRRRTQAPTG